MAALMAAGPLMRLFGDRVEAVITRLLGVLLAALAAQYVIDGLKGASGSSGRYCSVTRSSPSSRRAKNCISWISSSQRSGRFGASSKACLAAKSNGAICETPLISD